MAATKLLNCALLMLVSSSASRPTVRSRFTYSLAWERAAAARSSYDNVGSPVSWAAASRTARSCEMSTSYCSIAMDSGTAETPPDSVIWLRRLGRLDSLAEMLDRLLRKLSGTDEAAEACWV